MSKHRTNIYLTDELRTAVSRRARRLGVSNSAVIRSVLEGALLHDDDREQAQERLREVGWAIRERLSTEFEDDPDLRVE